MTICSVCAGTGKPISGNPCICGGSGTQADEMAGLRQYIYKLEARLRAINKMPESKSISGLGAK